MVPVLFSFLAIALYAVAGGHIVQRQFSQHGPSRSLYLGLAAAALVCHGILTISNLTSAEGVNFSLINAIIAVSAVFTALICLLATRFHVTLLLPLCFAWSGLVIAIGLFFHGPEMVVSMQGNMWLKLHMVLALLAYSLLVIATLFAGQMLFINNKLKSKDFSAVAHLPPLIQVERQLFFILAIGTMILLLSLLTGFIFLDDMLAKERLHKTVLSILSAAVFMVIIWGHAQKGWRGRPVFNWTLAGTVLLSLAYFGSRFMREVVLGRL